MQGHELAGTRDDGGSPAKPYRPSLFPDGRANGMGSLKALFCAGQDLRLTDWPQPRVDNDVEPREALGVFLLDELVICRIAAKSPRQDLFN